MTVFRFTKRPHKAVLKAIVKGSPRIHVREPTKPNCLRSIRKGCLVVTDGRQ